MKIRNHNLWCLKISHLRFLDRDRLLPIYWVGPIRYFLRFSEFVNTVTLCFYWLIYIVLELNWGEYISNIRSWMKHNYWIAEFWAANVWLNSFIFLQFTFVGKSNGHKDFHFRLTAVVWKPSKTFWWVVLRDRLKNLPMWQ